MWHWASRSGEKCTATIWILSSLKRTLFKGQLLLLPQTAESVGFDTSEFDVNDLVTFLQSLDSCRRKLLSEISSLGKLLLVMPATNAVSERSFSALKRVKTYLRSTTGDSRLNHLMMVHVHKDRTDALTLVDVANDLPPPQAFPRLSGDWGTREHARSAREGWWERDDGNVPAFLNN